MGFIFVPPAYPTRIRMTPLILPNRESEPQNHPRAKVAVSVLSDADTSNGGFAGCTADIFLGVGIFFGSFAVFKVLQA